MSRRRSEISAERRRAPRRARMTSVHIRLLLCLGLLALPAGVGTMAFWTDTATIDAGTIQSGTLDLVVGGDPNQGFPGLPGQESTFTYSTLTIDDLVPGESFARPFAVRNAGNVTFSYNATITTANNALVAAGSGLRVQVYLGGTPTNTGSVDAFNRVGGCAGGTVVYDQAVSTTSTTAVHQTNQVLNPYDPATPDAPGTTQVYCARILLHPDSPSSLQAQSTTLRISLNAVQEAP